MLSQIILNVLQLLFSSGFEIFLVLDDFFNLSVETTWRRWWTDSNSTEFVDDSKINLEISASLLLLSFLLFTFLALVSTAEKIVLLFLDCHKLSICKFLSNVLFVVFINHFFLCFFGDLLISWFNKTPLSLKFLAVGNENITRVNFILIWVFESFNLSLLFGESLGFVSLFLIDVGLISTHFLDVDDEIVLDLIFVKSFEIVFSHFILGLVKVR